VLASPDTAYYVNASQTGNGTSPTDASGNITWVLTDQPGRTWNVTAGDTINVAAGTYNTAIGESFPISITKSNITLQGAGKDTTIIDATGATGDYLAVMRMANCNNVTISDFTLKGATGGAYDGIGIYMWDGANTGNVTNCHFSNLTILDMDSNNNNAHGIYIRGSSNGNTFTDVTISNIGGMASSMYAYGIQMSGSSSNIFTRIDISNITATTHGAAGIGLGTSNSNSFTDTTISNLTTSGAVDSGGWCVGIDIDVSSSNIFSGTEISGVTAKGNTAYVKAVGIDITGSGHDSVGNSFTSTAISSVTATYKLAMGVYLWGYSGNVTDTTFDGTNTISNINGSERAYGIYLIGFSSDGDEKNASFENVTVSGLSGGSTIGLCIYGYEGICSGNSFSKGSITGAEYGVKVRGNAPNNSIHYTNIVSNTEYGVNNTGTSVVNATNNWWGDISGPGEVGPGTGDKISANVTYRPWLHWEGQSEAETATTTVSDDDPSNFNATAKADTEVNLSGLGAGASGSMAVAKYPTPFTATTLAHDTGKTALKYVDVQVGNLTQGKALIKVHYTSTGGLEESSLRLYYWDGSSWVESQSSSVDTANDYVQGIVPVNKLTGTPCAAGGSPPAPPAVPVPEFNAIGLLALIGILTIAIAFATLRKRE